MVLVTHDKPFEYISGHTVDVILKYNLELFDKFK